MSYLDSDYYDCNKSDDLMMEPRLMEYIKKKKFYKENGIEIDFLDKEFQITKQDMVRLKAYLRGDKKTIDEDVHKDYIDPSKSSFPSGEFKKDPRFDRVKIKQQKEAEAQEQRHDYGVISKGYDMYRDDRPFASASGNDFKKSDFNPNDWFKSSKDEMRRQNEKPPKNSFSRSNTYTNPKSSYNSYLSSDTTVQDDKHSIDAIIGQLQSYSKRDDDFGDRGRKKENENSYQAVPFMQNGQNGVRDNLSRDIEVDTYMRFGTTPLRAGKSLGYASTAEHSFSYISPDIQNPDHVVMDRGVPSRAFNKETARPYGRDVMR